MTLLYHAPAPAILVSRPRSCLDPPLRAAVNGILKELRVVSQRLRTAMTRQEEELRILERLYYKGKNQHRAALFWKRVIEIRRYCRRLDGLQISDVVDRLRYSFFGNAEQSKKTLKGAWTHIPDVCLVSYVVERLSACRALVDKIQQRLLSAYQTFRSALQSGAFIQLILILTAIASRMHHFMTDIHETLVLGQSACQRTLHILDPKSNMSDGTLVNEAVTTDQISDPMINADSKLAHANIISYDNIGPSVECTEDDQIKANPVGHGIFTSDTQALVEDNFVLDCAVILREIGGEPFGSRRSDRTFDGTARPGLQFHGNSLQVEPSAKKKKRKQKRDEIDEIFGD